MNVGYLLIGFLMLEMRQHAGNNNNNPHHSRGKLVAHLNRSFDIGFNSIKPVDDSLKLFGCSTRGKLRL